MRIFQTYETTIVHENNGMSVHVIVVPSRSLSSGFPENEQLLFKTLGLRLMTRLRPGGLNMYILSVLTSGQIEWQYEQEKRPIIKLPENPTAEQIEFAEYITCASVIPFEASPLSADSIGSIITKTSGTGMGAFVGYVLAGNTPMMLVLIPAGMILFGAAAGIASALEQGLRERILDLVRGKKEPKSA